MVPTLLRTNVVWILNKPIRTHFDQLLPSKDQSEWEPAHRLDYETSGAIVYALRSHISQIRKVFTTEGLAKKYYIAGATRAIPCEHLSTWPHILIRVNGFCASRYRHSTKVRFLFQSDELKSKKFHSIQNASHYVFPLNSYNERLNEFMSKNEWDSIRTVFDAPHLYLVQLLTGCRHQIRSYFAAMNAPLVGDPLYSKIETVSKEMRNPKSTSFQKRLQLHSWRIEFHDGENEICVTASLTSTN